MGLEGTYRIVLGDFVGSDRPILNFILRRRVCKGCNGGWMKDIDDAFMKHLGSGFHDVTVKSLDPFAQSWVARWVAKVVLLSELQIQDWVASSGDPRVSYRVLGYLPEGHIEHMGRTHQVPPNTQIWLGGVARNDNVVVGVEGAVHYHVTGPAHGVATALSIGPFAFLVVAHDVHHPDRREELWNVPPIEMPENYRLAFPAPIWPPTHPVVYWPPEWIINGEDFDAMARPVLEQYRAFGAQQ